MTNSRATYGYRRVWAMVNRQFRAGYFWARFGEATVCAPQAIQWLSDNGPQYTATASVLYAHALGLVPGVLAGK